MKNAEDTTTDYILQAQAATTPSGFDDKRRRYYNAKLVGLHETYHIICISIDVIFNEGMDSMFKDLDFP